MGVLHVRMSEQELARVVRLQERLQEREGPMIRVSQRLTVLRAVEALESYLDKLDRERGRKR